MYDDTTGNRPTSQVIGLLLIACMMSKRLRAPSGIILTGACVTIVARLKLRKIATYIILM